MKQISGYVGLTPIILH